MYYTHGGRALALEKPQARPGRGPTDDACRKRTVALSQAKGGTGSCDRARVCGLAAIMLHVYDEHSSGRGGETKRCRCVQSVYSNGKRFALCATNLSPCKPAEGER